MIDVILRRLSRVADGKLICGRLRTLRLPGYESPSYGPYPLDAVREFVTRYDNVSGDDDQAEVLDTLILWADEDEIWLKRRVRNLKIIFPDNDPLHEIRPYRLESSSEDGEDEFLGTGDGDFAFVW